MSDNVRRPSAYVIAGPNGAGKTTFATTYLPQFAHCQEFLNADLIAAGLSPFAPETQNFRAGRLMLTRLRELVVSQQDFGFESTLAGLRHRHTLKWMSDLGYEITLFFLWLSTPELAIARVSNRVLQGGHSVPERDIRRRFASGLRNFVSHYRDLVDNWFLYDGSRLPLQLIASESSEGLDVIDEALFKRVTRTSGE